MARSVQVVWIIEAELNASTALSVGGLESSFGVDMEIARDGRGRPYIPGTSLAGVLRARAVRLAEEPAGARDEPMDVRRLFGHVDARSQLPRSRRNVGHDEGRASHIFVEDAPIREHGAPVEMRDGVGLFADTGAAAEGVLYTRAVLPRGTRFPLRLQAEVAGDAAEAAERLLPALATSVTDGGLTVGAGSTRGLGRLEVVPGSLRVHRLDVAEKLEHLRAWWELRSGSKDAKASGAMELPADSNCTPATKVHAGAGLTPGDWRFRIVWRPLGPLMVSVGTNGMHVDRVPLATASRTAEVGRRGGGPKAWHAVLPGSSIKGALRAHAERILRSLKQVAAAGNGEVQMRRRRLRQLERTNCALGNTAHDLFGAARGSGATIMRGTLRVPDVHHKVACTAPPLLYATEADEGATRGPRDAWPGYRRHTRNAVDRWTGGAQDSALYTLLSPPAETDQIGAWEPIDLVFEGARFARRENGETERDAALALLLLVLRDMAEGLVPLGFGTRRGWGAIKLERIEVEGPLGKLPALEPGGGCLVPEGGASGRASWDSLISSWNAAWQLRQAQKGEPQT